MELPRNLAFSASRKSRPEKPDGSLKCRLKRNIPPPPSFFPSIPVADRMKKTPRKKKVAEVEEDECEEVREAFWRSYIQQLVEAEEEKKK
ncbi:hypothetical protein KJE20_08706 [Pyrenophora tritici-repentis]|nr:hypothetical protein KJE20_08706 [Pyrenophora tritici-repentis]